MVNENILLSTYLKSGFLTEGWNQTLDGFTDLCFVVPDESSESNEYHAYLTYEYEKDEWSGYFAYWTPEKGMPVEKIDIGDAYGVDNPIESIDTPVAFNGNHLVFLKLKCAIEVFIATCESLSAVRLMIDNGAKAKAVNSEDGVDVSYVLKIDVSDNNDFKSMCRGAMPHWELPYNVCLEISEDGTIMQFTSGDATLGEGFSGHMLIHPQEDGVSLRQWIQAFGLKPNPLVMTQTLEGGVLNTTIARQNDNTDI